MPSRQIIGLATGSGLLGIDAALVTIEGLGLDLRARIGPVVRQPFGGELADLVQRTVGTEATSLRLVARLNRLIGESAAAAARAAVETARTSFSQVLCLGWKGLPLSIDGDERWTAELRIGMPGVLAERTGLTTLADFASRDVAADGRGGPLSALTDYLLFRDPHQSRLMLHLGATSRLVHVGSGARPSEVRAYEAGPVATLLDAVMRKVTGGRDAFDPGGKHAVQGHCLEPLVERWLEYAAVQRRPPVGFAAAEFGPAFAAHAVEQVRELGGSPHDLLCTATHFVARCIIRAVQRFFVNDHWDRFLISGGGVRNGLLWRLLDQHFPRPSLERTDALGIPVEGREASAAALLAALTLDGVPGNLPNVTGASGSRLLGSFCPGSNANWARCLAWMSRHSVAAVAA